MTKETLSSKRIDVLAGVPKYYEKDVREFIQKEAELISLLVREKIDFEDFCYRRAELIGEELINNHSPQGRKVIREKLPSEDTLKKDICANCGNDKEEHIGYHCPDRSGRLFKYKKFKPLKKDWSGICATDNNRNQCSDENCILFPICKIKSPACSGDENG